MGFFNRLKYYFIIRQADKDFEHEKPENWIWGVFYFNQKDYRFILPKRNPLMGWTFNFAHPVAYITLVVIFLIAIGSSLMPNL